MTNERIVIVGNGRMAQSCAAILLNRDPGCLRLVVAEAGRAAAQKRLEKFCRARGIAIELPEHPINHADVRARIAAERPDFILSIDNFQVFGPALLALPARGCINFHNGLLDRYRGVNVPSWAIFNGEAEHGVCWHDMERAVDAGAVAASTRFALDGTETALSLTLDCVREGIALFEKHLDMLFGGPRTPVEQGPAVKLCKRGDLPNGGFLDPRWPFERIERMLRATDFRPFPNDFTYSRLRFERGELIVNEARRAEAPRSAPGVIVEAGDGLVLACADGAFEPTAVMLEPDREAAVDAAVEALGLARGQSAVIAH